jgi:hypothetical protein
MAKLSWQEEDILTIMNEWGVKPRHGMPIKSLWFKWSERSEAHTGDEMGIGINKLEIKELIEPFEGGNSEVILTDLGYQVVKKGEGVIPDKEVKILLKELKDRCLNELMALPDDTEIMFGAGNLSFYRLKQRGDKCFQIELNEN